MTKDYAKYRVSPATKSRRKPQSSSSHPPYIIITLVVVALLIGAGIGFGGGWYGQKIKPNFATKIEPATAPKQAVIAEADVTPPPRFEFYTLLPDMEVDAIESEPKKVKIAQPPATASQPKKVAALKIEPEPSASVNSNSDTSAVSTAASTESASLTLIAKETAPTHTPLVIESSSKTQPDIATLTVPTSSTSSTAPQMELAFVVQAGSFRSQAAAEKLKAKLAFKGLQSKIENTTSINGETWYRVVLGPLPSQHEAHSLQTKLLAEENLNSLVLRVRV